MRRENRRIAAMSWGGGDSDDPPPKPSRTPMSDSSSRLLQMSSMDGEKPEGESGLAMTYIVAQDPAILARLMRENEKRGMNPSAYTTQASVFNVLAVEFDQTTENKPKDDIPLKTSKIPAMELIPLQQDNNELFEKCPPKSISHNSQISGDLRDSDTAYPSLKAPSTASLPPQPPEAKNKSLERNISQNSTSTLTRISSLERKQQQMADYSIKNNRSQSLIRQYSAGIQQADNANLRSASLERNQQVPTGFKTFNNNFDKVQYQPPPPPYVRPVKGGSLERSQAIIMNDLMRKYYDQKSESDALKPKSGGSLERNVQYQQYLMLQKQQLQQQLQNQQQQALQQAQKLQQQRAEAQRQEEAIEENIYDFGGVHVKSCATIALKKSIERGMLPPNTMMRSPVYESNTSISPGPSSLESRPSIQTFKQPCPGIASRMMIFQQGSQALLKPQSPSSLQKPFFNPNFFSPQAQAEPNQVRKKLFQNSLILMCFLFIFFGQYLVFIEFIFGRFHPTIFYFSMVLKFA